MKTNTRLRMQLTLQNGIFALLLVAAAGLVIWLVKDYRMQWDLTSGQRNSLSDATRKVLDNMKGPIKITAYATTARDAMQGNLRQQVADFIAPYQRAKPDVSLQFVDPTSNPNETKAANVRMNGELIVAYGSRSEHLTNLSEQGMTNLLQRLLRGKEQQVAWVTGHGEPALDGRANFDLGSFGQQLSTKGFRVTPLNLAVAPEVPDNVSVLVITTPRTPLQKGEIDKIRAYLARGGNLLWLVDPGPLNGLEPIAEYLGLMLSPGVVVDPLGAKLGAAPTTAIGLAYGMHPITESFNLNTVFPFARKIELKQDNGDWHATRLVEVAQSGWLETDDINKDVRYDKGRDVPGPITIAVAVERKVKDKDQRVALIGGSGFLSNAFLGNGGNVDLGVNTLNWLAQDENLITIQPRATVDSQLKLTQRGVNLLGFTFLILVPAIFLFTGGTIWWRRRKA
jgi:ABC-type uncharacterized transport system involved in gliding motility auxiliary subunit